MCIDLKDFYLSGDAADISQTIFTLFEGELASLVKETIFFLLDNQYIVSSSLGYFYKCSKGSGIGLLHSAAVAALLYWLTVEKPFFDSPAYTHVITYNRFHDDIYSVFVSSESMHLCSLQF